MKLLIVIPSLSKKWGGTTTSLLNFYQGLLFFRNIEVNVFTTVLDEEREDLAEMLSDNNTFLLFRTSNKSWRYSPKVKKYFKEHIKDYDLVWIHALWTSTTFFAAKFAKKFKVPYILTPHGMFEQDALGRKTLKKKLYWLLIEKKVFDNAAAIHCINNAEKDNISQYTKTNSFVVPNGVSVDKYQEKDLKNLHNIGFIGRLHEKKGLDLLIKVLPKFPNLKLIVAGSGTKEYEEYLGRLVNELSLGDRIKFLGFSDEEMKNNLFKMSLFIVVPSFTEVLTFVALESLSHSTPVLITKQCNFDEIEEYSAGVIIENNQLSEIESGINFLLNQDLNLLSKNAYNLASEHYSIESVTKRLTKEFETVLSK